MPIELPTVPVGVLTLINLFAPYLIAVLNQPSWSPRSKRLIAVAASLALTVVVLGLYYAMTSEPIPNWPALLVLGVLVSQTSHALITRPSAAKVEAATSGTIVAEREPDGAHTITRVSDDPADPSV